jgi:hypothetical protein
VHRNRSNSYRRNLNVIRQVLNLFFGYAIHEFMDFFFLSLSMALRPFLSFLFLYSVDRTLRRRSAHRKAATYTQNNINTVSTYTDTIRTHDPSVRSDEDGSCFRPRGHCDRLECHFLMAVICNENDCVTQKAAA